MSKAISACSIKFNLFPILLQNKQKRNACLTWLQSWIEVHKVFQTINLFMTHQVRQLLRSSDCDRIS